jgi:phenylalanyl-tRNA synthetase beta chain
MNASYEWLRAFVPVTLSPAQLRDLFTTHTVTVDELVPLRADLAPIVVARVIEAARHPDSDHLWVTKVDAGGELLEVVCGAPNVTAGKLYPFAPVGTTMPNGMKLDRRKIRGVFSNGMLCSARELGLGEEHEGIMELQIDAAPGTPFTRAVPVGDTRLVLDVGANRPDLLSHLGLARELSAVTGVAWQLPAIESLAAAPAAPPRARDRATLGELTVSVDADTKTGRYMAAIVRGIRVGPSPQWLVRRLEGVGVRSINNVVDATNYVLHELGQPVHAFDLRKVGGGKLVVRRARVGEKIVTLDGTTRTLPADAVVIADAERAHAIAGVMGGHDSEVTDATTDLLIEVASFEPKSTRSTRRAIGLSTDASYRFERGVDPELSPLGLERVVRLILTLAGGKADGAVDLVGELPARRELSLRTSRVTQVLGAAVGADAARKYLAAAGFEIGKANADRLDVRVPSWRGDVSAEIDLIEEVARFHGYDKFPDEIRPYRPSSTFDDPLWTLAADVRDRLVARGLLEAWPIPFVRGTDETHLRLANPLAESEGHLRQSVLETLSKRAEYNLAQRTGDVRLFEIGSVSFRKGRALHEELRVGILVMGRRRPQHFTESQPPMFDEWDAKALAEVAAGAPYGDAWRLEPAADVLWQITVDGRAVGNVRRLSLDAPVWASPAYGIELTLGEIATSPAAARGQHSYIEGRSAAKRGVRRYAPLPVMPSAEFDLALLVPNEVPAARVEEVIRSASGDLLERLDLFDEYVGTGVDASHRSLAWRLTFRHPERTLRDKEIDGRRSKILSALEHELNVRQRSV